MDTIDRTSETQQVEQLKKSGRGRKKRRHNIDFKIRLVEETLSGRDSVSVVARRNNVNANQLFKWRRDYQEGRLVKPATLLPISVEAIPRHDTVPEVEPDKGVVNITLVNGHSISVSGTVCPQFLQTLLEALSA